MSTPTRDDFFTLIHKGLRRELFAVTTLAATIEWNAAADVGEFAGRWTELRHLLEIHADHEDVHFFPLLTDGAHDVLERMAAAHDEQHEALDKLVAVVDAALGAPTRAAGLDVHRELSAFVAGYLSHLLDEETVVMPAIWQHCSDDDLARARAAFLADMTPADAALSRRVMLPALAPSERAALLTAMRAAAPAHVVDTVLDHARRTLDARAWARLDAALASSAPPVHT